MSFRIGSGIDFHKLAEGRELWIGGVKIPHEKGAVGFTSASGEASDCRVASVS